MKKILLMCVVVLVSSVCFAGEYKFVKQVNVDRLQKELIVAGFAVRSISVSGGVNGVITFESGESKNPQAVIDAHVYVDIKSKIKANMNRMLVLAEKWIAGTITNVEKDELIKRFILSSLILGEMTD